MISEISILGSSEEEVLTCICRCAARYVVGKARPQSELETEEQQKESIKMQEAIYLYLHSKIR